MTIEEENTPALSVVVAFMIDLLGTFLCQASYLLMKFAHLESESKTNSALCSWKYFIGMSFLLVGNIIHVVVLPFCPVILLAINSSTAIIMTAILAIVFLKEKIVWRYDFIAFVLISGGCTGIVLLSQSKEREMTSQDVIRQITSVRTICFCCFYIIFMVCNYMLTRWFEGQLKLFEKQAVQWTRNRAQYTNQNHVIYPQTNTTALTSNQIDHEGTTPSFNFCQNFSGEFDDNYYAQQQMTPRSQRQSNEPQNAANIVGSDSEPSNERPLSQLILAVQNTEAEQIKEVAPGVSKHLKRFIKVPMVSQLSLAGIQAGYSVSSLKWFSEIVAHGDFGATEYWIMSVTIVIAICSALLQLFFLNSAISRYQQIDFSAVYQVTIMIFSIVCALVLLEEATAYSAGGLASILGCTGLCVLGIFVITQKTNTSNGLQESKQKDDEEFTNLKMCLSLNSKNTQEKLLENLQTDESNDSNFIGQQKQNLISVSQSNII